MGLKEQIQQSRHFSDEALLKYWIGVISKYYDHAYRMGQWDVKKAQDRRKKYNNDHEDEFFKELVGLTNKLYVKDDYLRALNRAMPDSVQKIRATLKLRLQDIADMTKEEADSILEGAYDLKALVYRIVHAVEDKLPEKANKEKKKIQRRQKKQ